MRHREGKIPHELKNGQSWSILTAKIKKQKCAVPSTVDIANNAIVSLNQGNTENLFKSKMKLFHTEKPSIIHALIKNKYLMENIMEDCRKNKRLIATSVIILVLIAFVAILANSHLNGNFAFRYIYNRNTGEPISAIGSILLYILFWWFIGLLPSATVFLFSLILYFSLHRKDMRLLERHYHPNYESEFHFGGLIAFSATYIAIFILLVLHICSLITISLF